MRCNCDIAARATKYGVVCLALFLLATSSAFAKPDAKDVHVLFEGQTENYTYFFAHPDVMRAREAKRLSAIPDLTPEARKTLLDEHTLITTAFYREAKDSTFAADVSNLEQVAKDGRLPVLDRSRTFVLAYLKGGNTENFVSAEMLSPTVFRMFDKVKDPDYERIIASLMSRAEAEVAQIQLGHSTMKPRYFPVVDRLFSEILCDSYFQDVPIDSIDYLWRHAGDFHFLSDADGQSVSLTIYKTFLVYSDSGARRFIGYLVESGHAKEIALLEAMLPEQLPRVKLAIAEEEGRLKDRLKSTAPLSNESVPGTQ